MSTQHVRCRASRVVPGWSPKQLCWAAALSLTTLTAWQALVETAGLRAGQRVLIHAAAGGVGHLAVQVAKERGAHVTGTANSPKHDFLRELGADACIDHRSEDFTHTDERYDVVLDALGG